MDREGTGRVQDVDKGAGGVIRVGYLTGSYDTGRNRTGLERTFRFLISVPLNVSTEIFSLCRSEIKLWLYFTAKDSNIAKCNKCLKPIMCKGGAC